MKTRNSKGITLIALVITIIILLILAGTSIAMLTGDNGLLTKAAQAKQQTEDAKNEELARLQSLEELIGEHETGTPNVGNPDVPVNEPFNVIFMIGDGMGQEHIKAGQMEKGEELNMQAIPNRAYVKTESYSVQQVVQPSTDSAAAATALATGVKTKNGYIGTGPEDNLPTLTHLQLPTICKELGLKTGVVTTQSIHNATPAGFTAQTSDRNKTTKISGQQIENMNVDLMLGGGQTEFEPLIATHDKTTYNYEYITNLSDISAIDKSKRVIGAFTPDRMTKDSAGNYITPNPSLEDMTKSALTRLENDNGFFVMIEGACIDTFSHNAQMSYMLKELLSFDNAVKIAMDYVDKHPNTLLIVTADHETGGLTIPDGTTVTELKAADNDADGGNHYFTNKKPENQWARNHTNADVYVYTYGKYATQIKNYDSTTDKTDEQIDNTDIYKFVKDKIEENY